MKTNDVFISGGLGDCLLHTPLIETLFNLFNKRINVFTNQVNHFELLQNNPYCDINLELDINKFISNKKNRFISYGNLLPSISSNESASSLICRLYGIKPFTNNPQIFLYPEEINFGQSFTENLVRPISFNPSSQCSKNQEWSIESWHLLIKSLPHVSFLQLGVASESLIEGAIDCRGKYSLREQLAILAHSSLYVGLDSFWGHACSALGIKGIILFGDSSPTIWGHSNNINIYKSYSCSPCIDWLYGDKCPYSNKCMLDIALNEVLFEINSYLNI